nr:MAG TPA: hypothetical protein [Caudoviricetes sp.]
MGGWHAQVLFIFVLSCVLLVLLCWLGRSVFCCRLACTWSQCSAWLHFVARVPVLNLTALCRPCLFLVGLAFPPCLVHIIQNHALHIYILLIHLCCTVKQCLT